MAAQELHTDGMTSSVAGISTNGRITIDGAKSKITIIDNNKIPFDESIKNLDRSLQFDIVKTNNTLIGVRTEYQKRIEVQECRSDLFWRVIGIQTVSNGNGSDVQTTVRCERLSNIYSIVPNTGAGTSLVGFTTNSLMWYTGPFGVGSSLPGITTVTMTVQGDKLRSDGSSFDIYYEPDYLHGMKLYQEPYDRDVFDMFVATGIGTVAAGGSQLTLLTPNVNLGITTNNIITPSQFGIFSGSVGNVVVGVSSTTVNLSEYTDILGIGTATETSVPLITLQDPAIGEAKAPMDDGSYVFFDFSKDPSLIGDEFAVPRDASPYVPQSISLFNSSDLGRGHKLEYSNSGISSASQEWNKFLEGFPDPDLLPDQIVEVEEPKVGPWRIYYPIGFNQKPVYLGADAVEGQTVVLQGTLGFAQAMYATLPTCDDDDLNDAISARNTAETNIRASDGGFKKKLSLVNSVRAKRSELNLAIWAYRTHIGDSDDAITQNDGFIQTIENSEYKDLMNTGTPVDTDDV